MATVDQCFYIKITGETAYLLEHDPFIQIWYQIGIIYLNKIVEAIFLSMGYAMQRNADIKSS